MLKKNKNKRLVNAFAFVVAAAILAVPLAAYADFTQLAVINGDGVRLRKTPKNGTILELMYRGEYITIDNDVVDHDHSAWIYVRREKTGTKGWMEDSYYIHDWQP